MGVIAGRPANPLRLLFASTLLPTLLGACQLLTAEQPAGKTMTSTTEAVTRTGLYRGERVSNIGQGQDLAVYRGIRYARSPTGERRWRAPEPITVKPGTEARRFGAACPQSDAIDAFVWSRTPGFTRSEDCLFLNVWAPAAAEGLPVMVWFHGGAHTTGFAHAAIFDGAELASQGVVVVTVNYRLGALGFLAHPALVDEHGASGNYGLLDKVQALRWVQEHIAAFGGDPNNVTIFGQSAGSQSVCALQASPLSAGLFHKAIGQSASCLVDLAYDPADANGQRRGQALATAALSEGAEVTAERLRALSPDALLAAELASGWRDRSRITVDGYALPEHPTLRFQRGAAPRVPLLVGFLTNEGEQLIPLDPTLDAERFRQRLARLSENPEAIKAAYQAELAHSPGLAWRTILADRLMALGMHRWATANPGPTWLYAMTHVPPAFKLYQPEAPDLVLPAALPGTGPRPAGAYHSGDLAFVFRNTRHIGSGWTDADHRAGPDSMSAHWVQFARTGSPQLDAGPAWPTFDANRARHAAAAGPT